MAELAGLQGRFAASLLAPGDYPAELFRGDPALCERRFALYRGNLTANWDRSLGNAYPVLKTLVGEEFFRALARAFGRAAPSVEGDLNRFGDGLADFLEDFAPVADYPYLPDVARLEWALHRAHYGVDDRALSLETLARLDSAALDGLALRLRKVCTLLRSPWAVLDIWQAHQPGGPALPRDISRTSHCLVCRPNWRAEVLPLSPGEFATLQTVDNGASLGAALEAGATTDAGFDPSIALPRWLQADVFAAPVPCSKTID